jgi:malate dehydrogenase
VSTLVIFGAGDLGGTVARQAAVSGVVGRIVLVDEAGSAAAGKALDQMQAAPIDGYSARISGTADEAAAIDASMIVIADRFGPVSEEWTGDAGLALLARAARMAPQAPIICAGATQIDLVERGVGELDLDRRRLFGSAPEALRAAVTAMTALEAGCAPADVSLTVVGCPGGWVVPWSETAIAGRAAPQVLDAPALLRLDDRIARLWPPGPRTLGGAAARCVSAGLSASPRRPAVFVVPDRLEHVARPEAAPRVGARGAALPVLLGPSGIVRVEVPRLAARDRVRLETALYARGS